MTRSRLTPLAALTLAAGALMTSPALAQDAGDDMSAERIAACTEDRGAEGCATVLVRVMVCAQAEAMQGCEAINAAAEAGAESVETAEPTVEVQAEGDLGMPADEDEPDAEDAETEDADAEDADEG